MNGWRLNDQDCPASDSMQRGKMQRNVTDRSRSSLAYLSMGMGACNYTILQQWLHTHLGSVQYGCRFVLTSVCCIRRWTELFSATPPNTLTKNQESKDLGKIDELVGGRTKGRPEDVPWKLRRILPNLGRSSPPPPSSRLRDPSLHFVESSLPGLTPASRKSAKAPGPIVSDLAIEFFDITCSILFPCRRTGRVGLCKLVVC